MKPAPAAPPTPTAQPPLDVPLLAALFALSRALCLAWAAGLLGYSVGPAVVSDVLLYQEWGDLIWQGGFPNSDPSWQYPPLMAVAFAVVSCSPLAFLVLALAADATVMTTLARESRHTGQTAGLWLWLATPVVCGPVLLMRYDIIVVALVAAALSTRTRRPASGMLLGMAIAAKLWPITVLLAFPGVERGARTRWAATTCAAVTIPLAALWGTQVASFISGHRHRGLHVESAAAIPFLVAKRLGAEVHVTYAFGAMQIEHPWGHRAGFATTGAGLALLLILVFARSHHPLNRATAADAALLLTAVLVTTSRIQSPQYLIWLLGIAALCLTQRQSAARGPTTLLVVAGLLTQLIYPTLYGELAGAHPGALAIQVARLTALAGATGWLLWRLLRPASPRDAPQRTGQRKPSPRSPVLPDDPTPQDSHSLTSRRRDPYRPGGPAAG